MCKGVPRKSITITLLIAACNECINSTGRGVIHLGNCASQENDIRE